MRRFAAALAGLLALGGSAAPANAPARYAGAFALPGAPHESAELQATRLGPLQARLDLWESVGARTIASYDLDMTERMHMIVVSDDFSRFLHVHPQLAPDGHFRIVLRVPKPGRYYVFADAEPHGLGQAVFRFALPFGRPPIATPIAQARMLAIGRRTSRAGPYTVTLSSLELTAGKPKLLLAHVTKNGKPAPDLHPYLGGAAHAVFISLKTLAYVHVHPMSGTGASPASAKSCDANGMAGMSGMPGMGEMRELPDSASVAPDMTLRVVAPAAGIYKLWLQFRGGSRLYVTPFILTAR